MTYRDVQNGQLSVCDFAGNAAADKLAVAGAQAAEAQPGPARQAWLRACLAMSVQRMMVDILVARCSARKSSRDTSDDDSDGDGDDRDSDHSSHSSSEGDTATDAAAHDGSDSDAEMPRG